MRKIRLVRTVTKFKEEDNIPEIEFKVITDVYDKYVEDHKNNVLKAFWVLTWNSLIEPSFSDIIYNQILNHDESKYSKEEYEPYALYFSKEIKNTPEMERDFDYAWLNHQKKNPHHYQYWILAQDDGTIKVLDMPYKYIIEMICDWFSFSIKKGDYTEIGKFYDELKKTPNISKNTKAIIEPIIDSLVKL